MKASFWRIARGACLLCGLMMALAVSAEVKNVSFNVNGGSMTNESSRSCEVGKPFDWFPIATRFNYTFVGWFKEAGGTNRVYETTIYDGTYLDLYAHWTKVVNYTCTEDSRGAEKSQNYQNGSTVTLAVPAEETDGLTNYVCRGWTATGSAPASGTGTNMTFTITNDTAVTWLWATNYWLEVTPPTNGTLDVASGWLPEGTNVTLTATPDARCSFLGWTGDAVGAGLTATVAMTHAATVGALFEIGSNAVTVVNGPGSGRYAFGTTVSLSVPGSVVLGSATNIVCAGWTGTGSAPASGTTTNCVFTLTSDTTVTWLWRTNYLLTVAAPAHGALDVAGGWFAAGTDVTLTATPDAHYHLLGWTGDAVGSGLTATVAMTRAAAAGALFGVNSNALKVVNGTGGGTYGYGAHVTIYAADRKPAAAFLRWTGDTNCLRSAAVSPAYVTMPDAAVTLTATYSTLHYSVTVVNGTGGASSCTNGQYVAITAAARTGQTFWKWTGDTNTVANIYSASTKIRVPGRSVKVTAAYRVALTVTGGTGGGLYPPGQKVTIRANARAGQLFWKWTGDTGALASTTSSVTTVTMPTNAVAVKSNYRVRVRILGGTGGGLFVQGQTVTIAASKPGSGRSFLSWLPATNAVKDVFAPTTKLVVPAREITLRARTIETLGAPYLIVDVSGGASATTFPVRVRLRAPTGGWNNDTYKTTNIVLRRLQPGKFWMGSPSTETYRNPGYGNGAGVETRHQVTLTAPFFMGTFQFTQKQCALVSGAVRSLQIFGLADQAPVNSIKYSDVYDDVLDPLRGKTGLTGFELPTEAQWEYACRAGTTTAYNNGLDSSNLTNAYPVGWYSENTPSGQGVHYVGYTKCNAWYLYDMHGNVFEWCRDWFLKDLGSGAVTNPAGPSSSTVNLRVVRGGSFGYSAKYARSACRYRNIQPDETGGSAVGFRLMLTAATRTETVTTDVGVPYSWLRKYGLASASTTEDGYETAAKKTAANGMSVWSCYVAGLDPTKKTSKVLATIAMRNAKPFVHWTPDLSSARVYTVYGKQTLQDAEWVTPTNSTHRFFKVKVDLP